MKSRICPTKRAKLHKASETTPVKVRRIALNKCCDGKLHCCACRQCLDKVCKACRFMCAKEVCVFIIENGHVNSICECNVNASYAFKVTPACTHNGKEISENLTRRAQVSFSSTPVFGSSAIWPEVRIMLPDLMPCEYEPSALGASGALIVVNDMVRIPFNDRRRFQTHSAQSRFGIIDKTFRPTVLEIVRANSRTPHRGTFKTTLRTRRHCRHAPRCK